MTWVGLEKTHIWLRRLQRTIADRKKTGAPPVNTGHCPCVGSMLGQRRRRWVNVEPTHGQCEIRDIAYVLVQCWASVADDGSTLNQHMVNVKYGTLPMCWYNVGPASHTVGQHWWSCPMLGMMVRWLRWHCTPDTGFEIRALVVWGRARHLSVTEAPHNTDFHTWMGKKHFLFLSNRRDREPNPELWRERQRC